MSWRVPIVPAMAAAVAAAALALGGLLAPGAGGPDLDTPLPQSELDSLQDRFEVRHRACWPTEVWPGDSLVSRCFREISARKTSPKEALEAQVAALREELRAEVAALKLQAGSASGRADAARAGRALASGRQEVLA